MGAMGLGKQPTSNESSDGDEIELQILLLISLDKVIYLYAIPTLNNELTLPLLLGHYINDSKIIWIGFLNLSTIYLIDKKDYFKILKTRKFNLGDVIFDKDLPIPIVPETNANAELQENLKFNGTNLKQMYLKTPTGSIKETYLFNIINNLTKDELNVLTNKKLYNQQLLD